MPEHQNATLDVTAGYNTGSNYNALVGGVKIHNAFPTRGKISGIYLAALNCNKCGPQYQQLA